MNELIEKEKIKIEDMIYEIRGKQVMLDSDLAKLYHVETKRINEAVKRNKDKFSERFSFILTNEESIKIEVEICDLKQKGGRRYNIRVFTEEGVAMLSTILKSQVATKVSIAIMDAFVMMRKYISNELLEQKYINNLVLKNNDKLLELDDRVLLLQESFDKLQNKELVNEIYFEGQIYDAYSKILDILNTATKEIIIIDNFLDKTILDMIRNIEVKVILITSNKSNLREIDINKYNMEYSNLELVYNNTFHDRYIIVDKTIIYHLGASINHAGSKTFSINILEDEIVKNALINNIKKVNL